MRCLCHEEDTGKQAVFLIQCDTTLWLFDILFGFTCCVCVLHVCRQQDLFRVLKAYTLYRPDEGYCQAQAPIAAVLLMHMPAEVRFSTTTMIK